MRLRQIEIFRAVMIAGSVSEAARMLNVSQPVVSRVLRHTEDSLGFPLFERGRGRLTPTPEAHTLFAQVGRAWREIERVDALAGNLRRGTSGLLRLAVTPSLATTLLPGALTSMRESTPEVVLDLWASHTPEIEDYLLAFDVDVGVVIEPGAHVALMSAPLASGEMLLAVPRAWEAAMASLFSGDGPVPWTRWHAQWGERAYIGLSEATALGERLTATLGAHGWPLRHSLSVQTYALAGTLVEHGLGYAFVDSFTAAGLNPRQVLLLRLENSIPFQLSMLRHVATPRSVLLARLEKSLLLAIDERRRLLWQHVSPWRLQMDG